MFIGHFGVGFAAKRIAPQVSLGTSFLAAQFIDLLWPTFLLLGLETVRIVPGATVVTPMVFEYYPFTHSLLGAACWAIVLGAAYALLRRDRRGALVVGALVLSHWVLDAIVHIPDLPIAPGLDTLVGLGVWQSRAATFALEVPIFIAGVWLYVRATPTMDRTGRWALAGLVTFFAVLATQYFYGPPPPNLASIMWAGQAQWLLVAWGYWIDAHARSAPAAAVQLA